MTNRGINIGDKVICTDSGITGTVLKFYVPTACEEQTMVTTSNGRRYHAPTRMWVKTSQYEIKGIDYSTRVAERFLEGYRDYLFRSPNIKKEL